MCKPFGLEGKDGPASRFFSRTLLGEIVAFGGERLAIAGERPTQMSPEATADCVAVLAEWEERNQRRSQSAHILQPCMIRKWRIDGRLLPTNSRLHVNYGMMPSLSTFLQFDTLKDFESIRTTLAALRICTLNPTHLKPPRPSRPNPQPRKETKLPRPDLPLTPPAAEP